MYVYCILYTWGTLSFLHIKCKQNASNRAGDPLFYFARICWLCSAHLTFLEEYLRAQRRRKGRGTKCILRCGPNDPQLGIRSCESRKTERQKTQRSALVFVLSLFHALSAVDNCLIACINPTIFAVLLWTSNCCKISGLIIESFYKNHENDFWGQKSSTASQT